jgi:Zn-dependent protease
MDQNYWQLGRWGRIPVSMHWTVLITFAWLYLLLWNLLATVIASAAFFALLVIHEMGHVAVLRRRRIAVESITLYGIHGNTAHGYASPGDEILVAWGGVAAQVVVLALAVAASYSLDLSSSPLVSTITSPVLFVFTKLNLFVMVVALLPIGPFDGRGAWAAIPWMRNAMRRRKRAAQEIRMFPEKGLSPERRRELEESSAKAAADLLQKFAKKTDDRKEDA